MVQEAVNLGFEYMELSHGIRLSLVPGILQAVDEGLIKISSVHNFCPLPPGVFGAAPNLYQPTANTQAEQALWFRHTLRTIDFAARVGAGLVVVHCGSIRYLWRDAAKDLEEKADLLPVEDRRTSSDYQGQLSRCLRRMKRKQKGAYNRLVENLQRIVPFAREKGVRLGLENREDFNELPMDTEMPRLLADVGDPEVVGYWHDCGHAQIKEQLQITTQRQLLEENHARQFGFHLHDVDADEHDHQPIGTGVIDWQFIRSCIRPEHLLVLELSPKLRSRQVLDSKEFMLKLLAEDAQAPAAAGK
ncbi:MAG: sugar phosphate isomerase/epimerase [Verrucomicrobiota bacterium JB022]|nr:sugar phosphate isomerase/epimerase [Verrucomicrobiota bacterium JB022]